MKNEEFLQHYDLAAHIDILGRAFVALDVRDVMAGDSDMGDMMAGDSGVAAIMGGVPGVTLRSSPQ